MITVSDEQFEHLITQAFDELPHEHMQAVKNVAIVYAAEPTAGQREQLRLCRDQALFGLYEGVPLARRQGVTHYPPDKITLFKNPIQAACNDPMQLKALIKHTLWHEIAHYFGLDHPAIRALEQKRHFS